MTLFGNRVFAEEMLKISRRHHPELRGDVKSEDCCPSRREERSRKRGKKARKRQRQGLKSCCHLPKDTRNHRKPEKAKKEHGLAGTLILNFWLPELWENTFLWFQPPMSVHQCVRYVVTAAQASAPTPATASTMASNSQRPCPHTVPGTDLRT